MKFFRGEWAWGVWWWRCIWVLFRVCSMAVNVFGVLFVQVEGDMRGFPHYVGDCRLEGVGNLLVIEERQCSLVSDQVYI